MTVAAPLSGRAVLVTGASSGIGRAIALATARAGADVALTYRTSAAEAQAVAREIRALGRRAIALQLDLSDEPAIRDLGAAVRHTLGRLDVWVNNAGADILTGEGASLGTVQKLDLLLAVDLRGTILASWAAADIFRAHPEGGSIINISWDHALSGMPGVNPQMFAAVKGGVLAFSKSLARSAAPRVRVNVVAPGWIDTAFAAGLDQERRVAVAESTPMGRWGTPDDVAGAVVYLASPDAAFLTGQTILVNGGVVM
ncbi:MAG: SDR family oxidoreductase [Acidimicrobiia bacterium]|nr:SDR family oxidoreductase [Acidimicrobiia bacterium]